MSTLLKEQSLAIKGTDGTERKLGAFHAVDEEKLNGFEDEQFLQLRQRNQAALAMTQSNLSFPG